VGEEVDVVVETFGAPEQATARTSASTGVNRFTDTAEYPPPSWQQAGRHLGEP
jgi:hypothetical protein